MRLNFNFTPDDGNQIKVPFLEDARADFAPYYRSVDTTSLPDAESKCTSELAKLGARGIYLVDGWFGDPQHKRYGYEINFSLGGQPGLIRVAGLPMKSETHKKIKQARVQALLNVRDWAKAAVTTQVFSPGSHVLIPYLLIDPASKTTVGEYIVSTGDLPSLSAPEQLLLNG